MPTGDPAGYLPAVKAERKEGGVPAKKFAFSKKKRKKRFSKSAPAQKSLRSGRPF